MHGGGARDLGTERANFSDRPETSVQGPFGIGPGCIFKAQLHLYAALPVVHTSKRPARCSLRLILGSWRAGAGGPSMAPNAMPSAGGLPSVAMNFDGSPHRLGGFGSAGWQGEARRERGRSLKQPACSIWANRSGLAAEGRITVSILSSAVWPHLRLGGPKHAKALHRRFQLRAVQAQARGPFLCSPPFLITPSAASF